MGKPIKERPEFGARVRQARAYAKFTQHQLGDAIGARQSTIADIETSAESSGYTAQIASACKVSAHWLATGQGPMTAETHKVSREQPVPSYDSLDASLIPVATVIDALSISLEKLDDATRQEVAAIFAVYAKSMRLTTKADLIAAIDQKPEPKFLKKA